MKQEGLTCSILEFGRIVGIKDNQARTICAGPFPPPLIRLGRETRVIRSEIPKWLLEFSKRQERLASMSEEEPYLTIAR